ncbi:MAG: hypothetical protein ACREGL_11705 [Alphaproteobacteria bacterium]
MFDQVTLCQASAVVAAALFTAAASHSYVTARGLRARWGALAALKRTREDYPRTVALHSVIAVSGILVALLAWRDVGFSLVDGIWWFLGAGLLFGGLAFGLACNLMFRAPKDRPWPDSSAEAAENFMRAWGAMHFLRANDGAMAALVFLFGVFNVQLFAA